MAWFRVDSRLVHGQIIEGWLPYLAAAEVVVVENSLATDVLRQQIMRLAIPCRIALRFIPVRKSKSVYDALEKNCTPSLFLFSHCLDVVRVIEQGVFVPVLNLGNMHYARGKKQICAHVALSKEDILCLNQLQQQGVILDFRCVPNDVPQVKKW